MRKIILLIAVLFMTVPAMAANVTVSCEVGGDDCNEVTVSYETDGTLIRAFGLTIQLNDPCVAITQVVAVDANYRIYPTQIEITDGEVTAYNTPYDPCYLGDSNLTIEMGSLYTTDANYENDANAGYNMIPGQSGVLLRFYVDDPNGTFDVNEDALSGGVVLEDPCEVTVVAISGGDFASCGGVDPNCVKSDAPFHADWVTWGEPNCWCYVRNCRGNTDGKNTGPYPVAAADLALFKLCYLKPPAVLATIPNGICCDFDHKPTGPYRVGAADLNTMKTYYLKPIAAVPECPLDWDGDTDDDYNFWATP